MPRTFPLPAAQFADRLLVHSVSWLLEQVVEQKVTGDGEVQVLVLAPPLWTAEVRLATMSQWEAVEQRALVTMHGRGRPFQLHNRAIPGPRRDPAGAALQGSSPVVAAVEPEGRGLSIGGLPPAYVLSVGDMLHIDYAADPVRRTLHQVGEEVTAGPGGATPLFDVDPGLPLGVTPGLAVTLVRAGARMLLRPGSWDPGVSERGTVTGAGFSAVQTRRW